MRGLTGKRILIAGAASGIGEAAARRLAAEGARLFLGDINAKGVAAVIRLSKRARFRPPAS
jgi:NAD(P)-dependent dehydrogenase (short-subunit alcohol dehydrogenase family)